MFDLIVVLVRIELGEKITDTSDHGYLLVVHGVAAAGVPAGWLVVVVVCGRSSIGFLSLTHSAAAGGGRIVSGSTVVGVAVSGRRLLVWLGTLLRTLGSGRGVLFAIPSNPDLFCVSYDVEISLPCP